ncbi:xylose isomerase [Arthrobacter sp. MYb229]|uniref:sugar phosphate isomerase/epimerase family protein n=1 Tax=unclassified Arthrobacter TaxID=235627 RepID=UPI000CFCCD85|nr:MULTISPECIES: sugar phosphate isomerase/epimerase [unclassified Arthrobacter]PRA01957.1 xylose isomerase [Arthrobacter sp. MYb229]PRB50466.1 xylose isomerase [Arthrobacter sp. MYb216]
MCFGFNAPAALKRSLEQNDVGRRGFLRGAVALGAGAGLVALGGTTALAAPTGRRPVPPGQISIQLYTLRSIMQGEGVDSALASLADYGYTKIELANLYGRTAGQMRATLDSLGLTPSSSHNGISNSAADLEAKLTDALTLGQTYINVPYLVSDNADDWRRWADQMNEEAAAANAVGLKYGYHNHAHEFTTDLGNGETPWDIFTSRLDPCNVHLEVDLYWAVTGGVGVGAEDPIQFAIDTIAQAPQKTLQYHVKDRDTAGDFADLGTGAIDFSRIFAAHRPKEFIVENDRPDVTPLQTAEVGYSYLRTLRF